jgi:hypothetical protein
MTAACESPGSGQECRATRRCSFTQTQRTVTHHETWDMAAPKPSPILSSPPSQSCGNEQRPSVLNRVVLLLGCVLAHHRLLHVGTGLDRTTALTPGDPDSYRRPCSADAAVTLLPPSTPGVRPTPTAGLSAAAAPELCTAAASRLPAASARWVEPARLKAMRQRPWLVGGHNADVHYPHSSNGPRHRGGANP